MSTNPVPGRTGTGMRTASNCSSLAEPGPPGEHVAGIPFNE